MLTVRNNVRYVLSLRKFNLYVIFIFKGVKNMHKRMPQIVPVKVNLTENIDIEGRVGRVIEWRLYFIMNTCVESCIQTRVLNECMYSKQTLHYIQ